MDLSFVRPVAALPALLALASTAAAQTIRLNGPLAAPRLGDVQDFALSQDGTRVVYRADVQRAGQFELFSAPLDGSASAKRLHAPTTLARKQVLEFAIGAGGRVAFRGDILEDGRFQVFSALLSGDAAPLELSGTLADVDALALSPDGTRAVFNDGQTLYSAPLDGSAAPVVLAPQPWSNRARIRFTPDSTRVLFTRQIGAVDYLGRAAIDGSQAVQLLANSGTPSLSSTYFGEITLGADNLHGAYVTLDVAIDGGVASAGLYGFAVDRSHAPVRLHLVPSPGSLRPHALAGERVVYTEPDGALYSVRTDGSGRVLLASDVTEFTLSPDAATVAFVRGAVPASELCVAPSDGNLPALVLAGPGSLAQARFSPDATLVYYLATDALDEFRGLHSIPVVGGTPLLLNGPAVPGGLGAVDFAVAPAGGRVAYREERAADGVLELWSVGPELVPQRLGPALDGFRDVDAYALTADGLHAAYLADQESDQTNELFGVPLDGTQPALKLNDPFPAGPVVGDVSAFQVTPDRRFVVYTADQEVDEFRDLFAVSLEGVPPATRLSAPLQDDFDVHSDVTLLPGSERVVAEFRADPGVPTARAHRLLSCTLRTRTPALELDSSPALAGVSDLFSSLLPAPDGTFVVYEKLLASGSELRRVAVDGSTPPLTLLALPPASTISAARLSPDAETVVYVANAATLDSQELYRVAADGSTAPQRLHAPLSGGRDVGEFTFSADGQRVVFLAALDRNIGDLYSVPVDGSAAARKLNSTLVAGVSVESFVVAPGSPELVYHSSGDAFFRVPADGSDSAEFLIDLPDTSLRSGFQLSPDGSRAFYRRESLGDGTVELFALPTAGGAPFRLNGPLVTGGEVTAFALGANGTRIVYLADERVEGRFELFSATLTSPGQPLWPTPPAGSDVTAFQLDPESRHVVFLLHTGSLSAGLDALYRVPLDASAPPELIHRTLDPNGDVRPDFLTLPRGRVLYRADAVDEVFELFRFDERPLRRR